jgi:hypothetical protein
VAQKTLTTDKVQVTVSGVFTTHHFIETVMEDLGELTLPASGKRGILHSSDGSEFTVERTSWWRGWHELRENEIVLGTARPQNFWRRTMDIGYRGATYDLISAGFWSRGWLLVGQAGTVMLDIQPRGIFRRGAHITILEPVNVDLLVFVYYLVNARWQEQAAGAAAGS